MSTQRSVSPHSPTNSHEDEISKLTEERKNAELQNFKNQKVKEMFTDAQEKDGRLQEITEADRKEQSIKDAVPTDENDIGITGVDEEENEDNDKNTPSSSNTQPRSSKKILPYTLSSSEADSSHHEKDSEASTSNTSNNRPELRQTQTQQDFDTNQTPATTEQPNGEGDQVSSNAQPSERPRRLKNKVGPLGRSRPQSAATEDEDANTSIWGSLTAACGIFKMCNN